MSKTHARTLTSGPEWKCILLFALPIMLGQFLQQLYSTVDGIVVGNYVSSGALAAVGNCGIMANLFLAVSLGMSNGSAVLVSQLFGAGRREDMRRAAATSLTLLAALGAAAMIVVFCAAEFCVVHVLGIHEAAIQTDAAAYLRIYALGFIFTFVYNAVAAVLRAVGDSRAVLLFLLVSTLVNTGLDLLFVAVFDWGVAGAAWATVISQLACVAVSVWYMARNYPEFRFRPAELRPERDKLRLCLKMGLPTTLQQLVVTSGHLFFQRLINGFGEVTMAAWTVGHRYDLYCSVPVMGMMQAMASFAGQNVGANRYDRVKRGLRAAVVLDLAIVLILGVVLRAFAAPLSALFGVEGEAQAQAVECLRFLSWCYPIFAVYLPFNGMFQGVGDPAASAAGSLTALSVRVAGSYLLVYCFHWDYHAIWTPYIPGWSAALIFVLIHYFRGGWKKHSLVRGAPKEGQE